MRTDDLPTVTLNRLKKSRWNRIIEKHEGPDAWEWQLETRDYAPDDMIYKLEPDYDPVAARPAFMSIGDH